MTTPYVVRRDADRIYQLSAGKLHSMPPRPSWFWRILFGGMR